MYYKGIVVFFKMWYNIQYNLRQTLDTIAPLKLHLSYPLMNTLIDKLRYNY